MKKYAFILLISLVSCGTDSKDQRSTDQDLIASVKDSLPLNLYNTDSALAIIDLIPIDEELSGIKVDLRYATENNFMKKVLYDTLSKAYLQSEVLSRLCLAQKLLDSLHPGYHLLVYDAVRPLNVQSEMWHAMDSVPSAIRGRYVSNPALGSVHNFGCAVDLTICDENSDPLDMGAGYDDFRDIAFPSKEKEFLESGELSKVQYRNRLLLRKVMNSQNFYNIPSEWWHFNAFNRYTAEKKFQMLLSETGTSMLSHKVENYSRLRDSIRQDSITYP